MDYAQRISCRNKNSNRKRFYYADLIYCERGFVTTTAVTLLPIFIFSALSVLATVWFIEQKEQIQWTCESHNLQSQKSLIRGMSDLLALNTIIKTTVLEKKFVQLSLAASPTPAEKAVLTARLLMLNIQLSSFAADQKALIFSAQTIAWKELLELRKKLEAHVNNMGQQWTTSPRLHFWSTTPQIKLQRKKIDPLAVIYLEHPSLSEQQMIKVDIAITGDRLFPDWLRWISKEPLVWKEHCLTQPKKENLLWNAKLKMDKLS